jgi:lantibiotic biosynthesis protein
MRSSPQKFLEVAEFLGAKLSRDAIWAGKRCNWFGLNVTELRTGVPVVAHRMCGPDYYSGTSGVAIFLAHLYAATGEKVFRSTAEGAIRQALSRLDYFPRGQRLAFQSGVIGIAHALLEVARTCGIEKFSAIALLILEEISCDELSPDDLDVTPGAIPALLKIHRDHPKDFLLQTALRLGENLLASSQERASSTASALLELYNATGKAEFQHAAEQAFLYQRKHLSAVLARDADDEKPCRTNAQETWPQSAATVGMARLRAFEVLGNDLYLNEAQAVLRHITNRLAHSLSASETDFSPARGLTGQADLLIEASRRLHDVNYRANAEIIGASGIDRYRKDNLPWPCGGGGETPGLMIGLAGIGYVYLRFHDPTKVPSLILPSM